MEIFDIVDESGFPTGETVSRELAHAKGIRHRTAHVWIVRYYNGKWQLLLQKRSANKDSFPGYYDTSSAGHIPAGFEPRGSALRELQEELGIKAEEDDLLEIGMFRSNYAREFHGRLFVDNEVTTVFVYKKDVEIESLTLQEEEVEEVKWFDIDIVKEDMQKEERIFCVPRAGLAIIDTWIMEQKE